MGTKLRRKVRRCHQVLRQARRASGPVARGLIVEHRSWARRALRDLDA